MNSLNNPLADGGPSKPRTRKQPTSPQPPTPVMEPRVMFVSQKRFWEVSNINSLGSSPVLVLDWSEAGQAALRRKIYRGLSGGGHTAASAADYVLAALTPRKPRKKGGAK